MAGGIALVCALGAAPSWVIADQDPARAAARALTPEVQTELPGHQGGGGPERAGSRRPRRPGAPIVDTRQRAGGVDEPASAMSTLVRYLLWGVVLVGASIGAASLVGALRQTSGGDEVVAGADPSVARAAIIERPLGDAEELARRGAYAEAIHVLLLRTLQELARSAAVRIAPSHTSREVLARVPLGAEARGALEDLIVAVELTHFGDEPAGLEDYGRCRSQFQRFAAAFRAGPGAVSAAPGAAA